MTPRDRFTAAVDTIASLSASDRLVLKAAGDEYAAGMIERHAHPPLPLRLASRTGQQGGAA
jgi:hypothetical protein